MSNMELYSYALCPYAHRTRLALAEKGLHADEIEIDPRNKPAGFLGISPHGKVPVLVHAGRRVWESATINEYLEDAFPERPLLPKDPIERAMARIWTTFADTHLYATTGALLHSRDPQVQARAVAQLADDLLFLEHSALGARQNDGPYWLGSEISLADLAFYPWFEQLAVLERYLRFELPPACTRLLAWWNAVARRDSVQSLAKSPDFYLEQYGRLL